MSRNIRLPFHAGSPAPAARMAGLASFHQSQCDRQSIYSHHIVGKLATRCLKLEPVDN
ncbi:hypothetical protein J4866_09415 [Prevotella denticola]|uniref:hypothetical protein n=1 Tax=Prevotella denticola TaxID=28129 RepID=UPI001BAA5DA8|nr:hypothetical protein [Prevotella denticola]QUB94298.1 hypothetical protein J4866_09415 [Prevotella denticola]